MQKKGLSLVLSGCIALSAYLPSYAGAKEEVKISDIKGHWAENQIQEFADRGLIKGYDDDTFRPNNKITRAEFIRLVNQVLKYELPDENYKISYKDVKQDQWFYKDVLIANDRGYIKGYEDNTFRANNDIRREEAAKIISNIDYMKDDNIDKILAYSDAKEVSNWSDSYVEYCIEREYLKGDSNNKINPKGSMTRAEAVVILDRLENGGKKLEAIGYRGDLAYKEILKLEGAKANHEETIQGSCDYVTFENSNTIFMNYSGRYLWFEGIDTHLEFRARSDKYVNECLEYMLDNKEEVQRFWRAVDKNTLEGIRSTQGIFA